MAIRKCRRGCPPVAAHLDACNFKAIASLNKMLVLALARCEYVERRENVIALDNGGTGRGIALKPAESGAKRIGVHYLMNREAAMETLCR